MSDLISPEYAELNRQLHAERRDYGTGAFRWAQMVEELKDEVNANTVLDYGSGKGSLKIALNNPDWLTEYDPAVPELAGEPKQHDLVACLDVLEHVEPEKLEWVLADLARVSKRAMLAVIATRSSTKTLPDGRNAHLIQEDHAWWRQRLERHFKISSWNATGGEIVCVAQRLHTIGQIKVISAVDEETRLENAKVNIAKCPRRLEAYAAHDGRVIIACFGPSLKDTFDDLKMVREQGGAALVSVSGAHDFLIERGLVPDVHIDIDPREHKGYFTRNPHPKVSYWMASCCHPNVIENLVSYDLSLFHIYNSETDKEIQKLEPEGFLLAGGGSVGCRALNVMYLQGYRKFHLFGMDCSFDEEGNQHAAYHSGKRQQSWRCRVGDRWFRTSGTLVAMARSFIENMEWLEKMSRERGDPKILGEDCIETNIHGDGMLAAMVARANSSNIEFYREMEDYKRDDVAYDPSPKEKKRAQSVG